MILPPASRRTPAGGALLLLAALFLGGCGGGGGTEPKVPTLVMLDASVVTLSAVGQTRQLTVAVSDQDGASIASPAVTWTSSNQAVATVNASGLVTAAGNGSAQISATAGAVSTSATVMVVLIPAQIQKVSGDQQTANVGQTLSLPLIVRVLDATGAPIGGATVTFAAAANEGTLAPPTATTDADGRAATAFTVLASGDVQVDATVASTALTTSFTETGLSPFSVELQFLTPPTPAQAQAFTAARRRWQSIIAGDLPDVLIDAPAGTCGDESPVVKRPVDDVLILVNLVHIDGPGGVLGASTPCYVRNTGKLTGMGLMRFDSADLDLLESAGLLQTVVLHEMAHVLGFGTLWTDLGLLADPVMSGGTDPHFTGAQATLGFNAVGGSGYTGGLKVPVEDTGNEGTADAHWRESVFGNELMTGFVQPGLNPLSRVTVASLADLGYSVDFAAADSYSLAPALRAFGHERTFELKNDRLRMPIRVVDEAGQVMRTVAP